jgi:hypothetical protein
MRHYSQSDILGLVVYMLCLNSFDTVVSCNSNPYNYMFLRFELQHLKGQRGLLFTNKTKDEVLK